jgi:hypothetical protein
MLWMGGLLLGSLLLHGGCRGAGSRPQPPTEAHLQKLAVFLGRYAAQHQGQSPPDEAAFRQFLAGLDPPELAAMQIANIDEILVSPRDNQPYVVRYGLQAGVPSPTGSPVVAYEQSGVGGRRYVAYQLGGVEEIDESRFRQLVPAP